MLVGIILTIGTDIVLHAIGVFPPWGQSMVGFDGALLLATAYRTVYGVAASYIIARSRQSGPCSTLGGRRRGPCREYCRRRGDVEQGTGLRSPLVSTRARRASDAAIMAGGKLRLMQLPPHALTPDKQKNVNARNKKGDRQ